MFSPAEYGFERFKWAATAVYSRNWVVSLLGREEDPEGVESTHIMVPVADMLNHKSQTVHYARGDEVFIPYGDKCNTQFLVDYGFTLPHNDEPCS